MELLSRYRPSRQLGGVSIMQLGVSLGKTSSSLERGILETAGKETILKTLRLGNQSVRTDVEVKFYDHCGRQIGSKIISIDPANCCPPIQLNRRLR
jgi:hypothetical protein